MKTKILLSKVGNLSQVTTLYAQHRSIISSLSPTLPINEDFLKDRIIYNQAIMLEAKMKEANSEEQTIGFAHLYPSFSSVGLKRIFTMTDIYVPNEFKESGAERLLISQANKILTAIGAKRLIVKTSYDHTRDLLTHDGYKIDPFVYYFKLLYAKLTLKTCTLKDNIEINKVSEVNAEIYSLFDKYRMFYKQPSNETACKEFLTKRIYNDESVVFKAKYDGKTVGFVQLYPCFSSLEMLPAYVLNDLYVEEKYRKLGVASRLIEEAENFLVTKSIARLSLKTASDNPARKLYEKLGYKEEKDANYYYMDFDQNVTLESDGLATLTETDLIGLENVTIKCE